MNKNKYFIEDLLGSIFATLFLCIVRYVIIIGIYYFFKHEINFYDILIIIAFTALWNIEGTLNSISVDLKRKD